MTTKTSAEATEVVVLPITHRAPENLANAVEIPPLTKRRLGLDYDRSWIVVDEANRFTWPGPDLRPSRRGDLASVALGVLPPGLFDIVKGRFLSAARSKPAKTMRRTD